MKEINCLVIEPTEIGLIVHKDVVKDYKDFYKLGGFDMFDVVRVNWGELDINIYLDDEGLLKSGNLGRMVEGYPNPLFGTLIITGGTDSEGNTLSVPDELNILDIPKYVGEVEYVVK